MKTYPKKYFLTAQVTFKKQRLTVDHPHFGVHVYTNFFFHRAGDVMVEECLQIVTLNIYQSDLVDVTISIVINNGNQEKNVYEN